MEREKLMIEYRVTLESLVEKSKFIYSEEFYELDEFEKQKYQKDKMTTEAHLSTLCNLLWDKKVQFGSGGVMDAFALALIGGMFGGNMGFGAPSGADYLKKELENIPVAEETESKAE